MARTVGVSMVRDEEDIIGATVRHLLGQVDAVLIADNRSIDGTRDVLADIMEQEPLINPDVLANVRKNALRIVEITNILDEEIR